MAETEALDHGDLDWAKPLLDETRKDVEYGFTVPHQEVKEYLRRRIDELRRS
jgi:hypothetical protein